MTVPATTKDENGREQAKEILTETGFLRRSPEGDGHGSGSCSLCRTGCAQEERIRLRDLLRDERREAAGEAKLRDRDGRAAEFGRLAERTCRDARRHGVNRGLLAAGMGD